MRKPVYGFEQLYQIDENGVVYSLKDKRPLKLAKQIKTKPFLRLADKKYYSVEELLIKSGIHKVNDDEFLYYLDGNLFNTSYANIKILNKNKNLNKLIEKEVGEKVKMVNENYFISATGQLYSFFNQRIKRIKPYLRDDGYYEHYYSQNGIRFCKKTHRLVAEHFLEKREGKDIVNHINGIKTDNRVENLEWTNSFWNNEHAKKIGLNNNWKPSKMACLVDKDNTILLVCDSIVQVAEKIGKDSSTASKQTRGIKNRFQDGTRVRLFDEKTNSFIPTRFD